MNKTKKCTLYQNNIILVYLLKATVALIKMIDGLKNKKHFPFIFFVLVSYSIGIDIVQNKNYLFEYQSSMNLLPSERYT